MSTPASIRISDDGYKALRILETTTKKKRVDLVSEALIEKANGSSAAPVVQCRLLDQKEILTLQSEIAALEKLHDDNRRNVKIRTSDKAATEKIIKLIEKIDAETKELQAKRLALGSLATISGTLMSNPALVKQLIGWVEARLSKAADEQHPAYELELKILRYLYRS